MPVLSFVIGAFLIFFVLLFCTECGIKALDERLSGEIKALENKVDGIGKRLDNQEFLNRGVVVAVLAALIAGGAKLFGFLPKG